MWSKLKNLKLNIRQRVLLIIFGCCLFIFAVMATVSFRAFLNFQDTLWEQGDIFEERIDANLSALTETRTKEQLAQIADLRALYIDHELSVVRQDVEFLADSMSKILQSPQRYNPRPIINTRDHQDIFSGEVYIHYSPELLEQGISTNVAQEIDIATNIADILAIMGKSYKDYLSSLCVGSRNGYLICIDLIPATDNRNSIFQNEQARENFRSYDPRTRLWYKLGEQTNQSIFTNPYVGKDGLLDVTCVMPYYDNEGFAGVAGISYSVEEIYHQVADGSIAENGFNFVLNQDGIVILSTRTEGMLEIGKEIDLRQSSDQSFSAAARRMVAGERDVLLVSVNDKEYYLAFTPMQNAGWSFGMLVSKDEVMAPVQEIDKEISEEMNRFQYVLEKLFTASAIESAFVMVLLVALSFAVSKFAANRITQPISALTKAVHQIATGNLGKKVQVHTGDELENLADCFNLMTDELISYMNRIERDAQEKERTRTEMDVARKIQASLLPRKFPAFPEREDFDIYALMHVAKAVGGDFYDFYLVNENHLVFTIADVSGKGVPAALFMVVAKSVIKNFAHSLSNENNLSNIVSSINNQLAQDNVELMFVSAFIGLLNLRSGKLACVNAGLNSPLLYRKSETRFDFLPQSNNLTLGVMEDIPFSGEDITLAPGDVLFLYTDGVTEALSETKELFGQMRLLDCLNRSCAKNLKALFADVQKSLAIHVGQCEQSDDITMLAITWNGKRTH